MGAVTDSDATNRPVLHPQIGNARELIPGIDPAEWTPRELRHPFVNLVVAEVGWPGQSMAGEDGSHAAGCSHSMPTTTRHFSGDVWNR
jgi:hypothetical protein